MAFLKRRKEAENVPPYCFELYTLAFQAPQTFLKIDLYMFGVSHQYQKCFRILVGVVYLYLMDMLGQLLSVNW